MVDDDNSATRLVGTGAATAAPAAGPFDGGGFTPGVVLQGRYRIIGLMGRAAWRKSPRAQDLKLGQAVAVKLLPEEVGREPGRLERFLNEVRIARRISHPNVCRVYDVGDMDGRHFLSMEFRSRGAVRARHSVAAITCIFRRLRVSQHACRRAARPSG